MSRRLGEADLLAIFGEQYLREARAMSTEELVDTAGWLLDYCNQLEAALKVIVFHSRDLRDARAHACFALNRCPICLEPETTNAEGSLACRYHPRPHGVIRANS